MIRRGESYQFEAKGMVQFILEGHNEQETADEFDTSRETVRRRLRSIGYNYADLAEMRDATRSAGTI